MRAIIFIFIIAVLVLIGAIATGFLNISQVRSGQAPQLQATHNGVAARGGQAPAFKVQTGSLSVGSSQASVKVPKLEVQKPGQQQAATNNAQ